MTTKKKAPKLTPWFPVSQLPLRAGVYEVKDKRDMKPGWWSWFDGKYFRGSWMSPDSACDHRRHSERWGGEKHYGCPVVEWRGLAENPKAKHAR